MQLAKLELHDRKYDSALRYADAAVKLTPDDHSVHFVRGQILQKLGRQQEANTEFAASRNLLGSSLERERANFQKDQVPGPQLATQPCLENPPLQCGSRAAGFRPSGKA
jgi:predicted negative regulator of RcsB-dependent stress response